MLSSNAVTTFLSVVRSDDTSDVVQECFDVLDTYNIEDYMSAIELAYSDMSELGDEERAQSIVQCLMTQMTEVLSAQGFVIADGLSLRDLCTLAKAVGDIIYYEDHSQLRDICVQEISTLERMAEMMTLVSPLSVERCLEMIVSVGENCIDQILDLLRLNESPVVINENYVEIYTQYNSWMQREGLGLGTTPYARRYISSVPAVGVPFLTYVGIYLSTHVIEPDPTVEQAQDLARELIALAMVASDSYKNILMSIKSIITQIYPDVKYSAMLDHAVTKFVLEFQKKPL